MAKPFVPQVTVETCERRQCGRKFERADGLTGGYCSDACLQIDNRYLDTLPPIASLQHGKYSPYTGERPIKRYTGYLGLRQIRGDDHG